MRKRDRFLLALCCYAVLSMAKPAIANAQGATSRISVFIASLLTANDSDEQIFNRSVDHLRSALNAVRVEKADYESADYQLIAPKILRQDAEKTSVSMKFVIRGKGSKDDDPISVWSPKTKNPEERVRTAFDLLLVKTLFDPTLGPYGAIHIDGCSLDSEGVLLSLQWDKGPGLESHLVYELGEQNNVGLSRLGIFYCLNIESRSRGTAKARISHMASSKGAPVKDALDCKRLTKPGAVLLPRAWTPSSAEGSGHESQSSLF